MEPDGLSVTVTGTGPVYIALFTLPAPEHPIEAYFAAAMVVVPEQLLDDAEAEAPDLPAKDRLERALKVVVGGTTPETRQGWNVPVRYFTLERGLTADGGDRTVLCEWAMHDTGPRHLNFGDGPDAGADAFLHAVTSQLLQTRGGDA
jgi:hypothetical protein